MGDSKMVIYGWVVVEIYLVKYLIVAVGGCNNNFDRRWYRAVGDRWGRDIGFDGEGGDGWVWKIFVCGGSIY
jgi:hypothetical protein